MSKSSPIPPGVVALFLSASGGVVATHADFEPGASAGYSHREAQVYRATRQVKWAAVRAYSSQVLVEALDNYMCDSIADAMCRKGCRIQVVTIGHDDKETSA